MTSKYFDSYHESTQERLYQSLIDECIGAYGISAFYLPRGSQSVQDLIFGDDPTKEFTQALPIDLYVQTVEGFEGGNLYSKFGYQIDKQASFLISKTAVDKILKPASIQRPMEGDLLWLQNFRALFEITYVNQDYFFYTFGNEKFYGFSLVCEMFRYNNEPVATKIPEIDSKINESVIAYAASLMANANSMSFIPGETVYQGANLSSAIASATVLSFNRPSNTLILKNLIGTFQANTNIHGILSEAIFEMLSIQDETSINDSSDNADLTNQIDADDILNTSETNPLGNIEE